MPTLREIVEADLVANPDDMATHMAYADLLQEEGDPRGEFIQLQLALEQIKPRSGKRAALRRRINSLLNEHAHEWLGELAPHFLSQPHSRATPYAFARGWIDTFHLENLGVELGRIIARSPLVRLLRVLRIESVLRVDQDQYTPGSEVLNDLLWPSLAILFASPVLGNLRRLELHTHPYPFDVCSLAPILNSPHLGLLTHLRLRIPMFGERHCEALTGSPLFVRLRELDLSECYLLDGAAQMLAQADLQHLTFLNVANNYLSEEGIAALAGTGVPLKVGNQGDSQEIPY